MDLDEWEFLPTDGFIDFDQDRDHPQPKNFVGKRDNTQPKSMLNMDYFICPSSPPSIPNQIVRLPLLPDDDHHTASFPKQITNLPTQPTPPSADQIIINPPPKMMGSVEAESDQDGVSQVFFKKKEKDQLADMKIEKKENDQLADMKIGSPRAAVGRVILPQIDSVPLKFDSDQTMESKICGSSPRKGVKGERDELDCCDGNDGGFDLWKWSLTGIGAICSFGVAAATMFIVILGTNNHRNKQLQHTQKLRFEIYDDKRIKQVVQQASKLNEAIFAVRGVPINRAPISIGAHYDGL
ncbi:uncharacterized protein LOC110814963 isoform X2 [Carica papaya]|uniref:uncharacterized protein LOC110814963 isoform X2 n=1 Tax=Carica papaya TaxID=3649 RepID=UPI000B8C83E2|nr:uncharacterized protein LOC110814963 isoform X2 [Carica papaya]